MLCGIELVIRVNVLFLVTIILDILLQRSLKQEKILHVVLHVLQVVHFRYFFFFLPYQWCTVLLRPSKFWLRSHADCVIRSHHYIFKRAGVRAHRVRSIMDYKEASSTSS